MKLLVVSPKFHPIIGGGETYVLNSVSRLRSAGIDVSIAVEPHPARQCEAYQFPVFEVPGLSDAKLDTISAPAGLYALCQTIKPDIIHAHGYFALLALGLSNATHIPIIASIHSTPVWGERIIGGMNNFDAEVQFAQSILELSRPCMLTAANEVYADAARRVAERRTKVVVLPYPVDADFFYRQPARLMREALGIKKSEKLILTPSRILERKGIREIIFALAELPNDFYLCLPGAVEPLDPAFWASVCMDSRYKKVQRRIIIPKRKMLYDDMPLLYAASDIVAMPSYYEGAPVATVEAMASGKPFVGADSQGINSFIRHEENGLLVPVRSVTGLAQAIIRMTGDTTLQEKVTIQARKDIQHLTWEKQLPVLMRAYDEVRRSTIQNKVVA